MLYQQFFNYSVTRDIVANLLDCDIVVNEFELHPCYYVQFWTNTFREGMNHFILLAIC